MSRPHDVQRLHSLDALRGVAALAVVLWHWQHFFLIGPRYSPSFSVEAQPFFDVLRLFYLHGHLAVDTFFALSGFIFFWLYARTIEDRALRPGRFFVLRFSRLYPLHLVTLLLVAGEQALFQGSHSGSFVYQHNDARHFVLNLLLLPSVGLERGYSFNAPVWSVSVEAILYVTFFAVCRVGWSRPQHLMLYSIGGFFVLADLYLPLGRGIGSFYVGGAAYHLFTWILASQWRARLTWITLGLTAILWIIVAGGLYAGPSLDRFPELVLFPASILSLALLEAQGASIFRHLAVLGEISYSSYLLHFPLQLAFVMVNEALGGTEATFTRGSAVLGYAVTLLTLSWLSYHHFELPAQRLLRLKSTGTRQPPTGGLTEISPKVVPRAILRRRDAVDCPARVGL